MKNVGNARQGIVAQALFFPCSIVGPLISCSFVDCVSVRCALGFPSPSFFCASVYFFMLISVSEHEILEVQSLSPFTHFHIIFPPRLSLSRHFRTWLSVHDLLATAPSKAVAAVGVNSLLLDLLGQGSKDRGQSEQTLSQGQVIGRKVVDQEETQAVIMGAESFLSS